MEHDERNDDLTPVERAAWAALPDERPAPRLLEERTVRALRRAGRLHRRPRPAARMLGFAAAAAVLFAAGLGTGLALPGDTREPTDDAALRVQRAGSEYVRALTALGSVPGTSLDDPAGQVALTTFYGAARELARIAGPRALEQHFTSLTTVTPDSAPGAPVIWF